MKHLILSTTIVLYTISFSAMSQQVDSIAGNRYDLIMRADSLMAQFKFERALNILQKADSLDVEVLLRVGQCNFRLGASGAAIRPYERVIELDSTNLTALNHLGQLYARKGEYNKALSSLVRLIELDPTNSYYYKQAGTMAVRSNEILTAKFWFEKALNLNPGDVEAALALGNILMDMENYERVDSIVHRGLEVDSDFKPLLLLRAKSAFEQQHYSSVIITVNSLLTNSDTTALYARLLGVSYFKLQDYTNVVTCMNFLLKNRYDYEWIYFYRGVAARELGDVAASVKWLRLAAQKSISDNTKIYYSQLGQSYEEMGNYQEAIRAYRTAYNYSREGILLYHLARNYDVYYEDKATALMYYQKYLESDDTIRLAREYARKRVQDMGIF